MFTRLPPPNKPFIQNEIYHKFTECAYKRSHTYILYSNTIIAIKFSDCFVCVYIVNCSFYCSAFRAHFSAFRIRFFLLQMKHVNYKDKMRRIRRREKKTNWEQKHSWVKNRNHVCSLQCSFFTPYYLSFASLDSTSINAHINTRLHTHT